MPTPCTPPPSLSSTPSSRTLPSRPESPCERLAMGSLQSWSASPVGQQNNEEASDASDIVQQDNEASDIMSRPPLWISLLHVARNPLSVSPKMIARIDTENNPRPMRHVMADGAKYWIQTTGDVSQLKFPARINRSGQFARTGPYFNLPSTSLEISALQKARAQFELIPLEETNTQCPPEALMCSQTLLQTLFVLHNEVENARADDNAAKKPSVVPFWHTYEPGRGDFYSLVMTTDTLFHNLPHGNRANAPKFSRSEIGKHEGLLSPSKARAAFAARRAEGSSASASSNTNILQLADMPDPLGRYAGMIRSNPDLADTTIFSPDICDRHRVLITPNQYDTKILDGDYVEIDIILKLWEIAPNSGNGRSAPNGSRIYQAILKSMKLLLFHTYTSAALLNTPLEPCPVTPTPGCRKNGKGKARRAEKRKADEDDKDDLAGDQLPSKKRTVFDVDEDCDMDGAQD